MAEVRIACGNFSWKVWREETTWEDNNIKIYLKEIGVRCRLESSGSSQGAVAGFCEHGTGMNTRVP
jgi:hypothetical protein